MALNKVMLIGKCGGDPEIREVNGSKVASISIATTERFRDKSGETKEQTEWHRVIAWRHIAEFAENNVRKGTQVFVEGKIKSRKWTDQQGVERYATEIHADNLQILGRKQQDDNNRRGGEYNDSF